LWVEGVANHQRRFAARAAARPRLRFRKRALARRMRGELRKLKRIYDFIPLNNNRCMPDEVCAM
jgi:hypothetical protein